MPAFGAWLADARGDGLAADVVAAAVGPREAARELVAAGVPAARLTGLPWLGRTVSTTAAAAAATTRRVTAAAAIPVRKLTSSRRALTAARIPAPEPVVR